MLLPQGRLTMLTKKEEKTAASFWQEYEEKTGEKVIKRGLGKYISGWDEFDEKNLGGMWGLIISTTGGFRFHNFPQNSWIDALTRFADSGKPKEKTIFLPQEKITSIQLKEETNRWKRFFCSCPPEIIVTYTDEDGNERKLVFEAEYNHINTETSEN